MEKMMVVDGKERQKATDEGVVRPPTQRDELPRIPGGERETGPGIHGGREVRAGPCASSGWEGH